jgi:gamma-glutamyltranspeptidase
LPLTEYVALQLNAKETAWRAGQSWIADPGHCQRADIVQFLERFSGSGRGTDSAVDTPSAGSDTTYIATVDRSGNWASLIQSVHQSFGCGVVADGTGIVLNNRMSGFNLTIGHANEIGPNKLPAHTLSPALIVKENKPVMAIGTPGGFGQTQFLAHTLCNLLDFGMNLQAAIEAPRWQSESVGSVDLESRFADEVSSFLISKGYKISVQGPWEFAFGGVEAIRLHDNGQVLMGAADPRRDGYAVAY